MRTDTEILLCDCCLGHPHPVTRWVWPGEYSVHIAKLSFISLRKMIHSQMTEDQVITTILIKIKLSLALKWLYLNLKKYI